MSLTEDEIIEDVLNEAWKKLLAARKEGKLPGFDYEVPAQIQSWLCEIYAAQLDAVRLINQEMYDSKRLSISMAYRISLRETVGIDYFMRQMNDVGKMSAFDRLIADLERGLKRDNEVKRLLR